MERSDISLMIVILLQNGIGISVNGFHLLFYVHTVSANHKLSSSDMIHAHLVLANTIILLTYGIPETMSTWGLKDFLGDIGCKIIIYFYRVARSLTICTTCLLSVFQAVTISPSTSRWARLKLQLPKCILPSCILFWILGFLIDVSTPMHIRGPQNSTRGPGMYDLKYCSLASLNAETALGIEVVLSLRDLFFVGLMIGASGYMVFVLHRHHQQVQHLHGPSHSPRVMPEVRATKRVIALVALYVLLYGRQSIMLSIIRNRKENSPLLVKSHVVLSSTFSAISPFLVIHRDRRKR
ncbi:vomeronasal 1 receptor ornAnaV1R3177 [Ornithorhynchus anatinus]|uniref:vomeronasal 1 receptor ornAnaV1R3177 n=1 Tax=Ornithorhynchus anatinus TaxID=9258 RepID=UPI000223F3F1|nr:vomeronasal 1 receptor ornAnaV1R3177 [Ornithorhynchus anatinus]